MKKIKTIAATLSLILPLSACGVETPDRVISGAGLGAVTGIATYALFSGPVVTGMAVGAAAGAIAGGVTSAENIYLGKPLWKPNDPEPTRRNVGNAQW